MKRKKIIDNEIVRRDFASGGEVSSRLKKLLRKLGVDKQDIRRTSIITYELEMNLIIHSEGGRLKAFVTPESISIISKDKGPGIENIDKAFEPGYSTATDEIREMGFGAGMGLNNVKRFSDKLEVESEVGQYTKLKAIINLNQ
ncbi:MAG TPA: ATP-binding protein [Halanaerobiales bacterium]|nr:ATP-binding protein [Halanaerobiales bacterium]